MNPISIFILKVLRKLYAKTFGGYVLPPLQREENIDKIVENFKDQLKFNVDIENLKLGDEIILRYEPDVNYLEILANAQIKLKFSNKHVIYKN